MARSRVTFDVDKNDIKRVRSKFARASGKSLYTQLQRGNLARGDLLKRRMQAEAPRASGKLRRAISVRPERRKGFGARGSSTAVLIGPTARKAPHRHLVIRGTGVRPVVGPRTSSMYRVLPGGYTSRGRALVGTKVLRREAIANTGRMKANPFVDRAARGFGPKAARLVMQEWKTLLR